MLQPRTVLESNDVETCRTWIRHQLAGDWFTSDLVRLIMKADANNKARLMEGFPDEVGIVIWYQTGMNPEKLVQMREERGRGRG